MAKIVLSLKARRDLDAIEKYIAEDNPSRARSYIEELLQHCYDSIASFPYAFPLTGKLDIRCFPYQKYNVYYRYDETQDAVHIAHILNSAQMKNLVLRKI
ncbi:type II toxin-antitoxin system RelE/ParE family toxin [Catenovulum sediminis]|uniref:type II toxin-antitoxin system RelE/ParE family toxin n=1 Tax=Catenovulum sediminis TaxID=1740262 RepID=UPI00117E33B8|nr:type II toxin-antitoxin system RelE/ParE family toxin [Catenovulum sediminis]